MPAFKGDLPHVGLFLRIEDFQICCRVAGPHLGCRTPQVDEAFMTGSSREIMPVVQIDDLVIGNGRPGKRTYELEQRFIEMVERGDF